MPAVPDAAAQSAGIPREADVEQSALPGSSLLPLSGWFQIQRSTISPLLFSENYLFPFAKFLRLLGLTGIILPSFVVQEPSGKRALGLIRHLMKNSVKN